MRQPQIRRLGRGVYAVSSHSRQGHFHKVAAGICSCPAVGYCSHLALALDAEVKRDASISDYLEYMDSERRDFAALELRVLHGETTADDRRYVRPCVEKVMARQATSEVGQPAGCSF
jgi:hypothetical protein